jgi:hypothetical protein
MRWLRKLIFLFIILFAGAILLYFSLDSIVKKGIESVGPLITDVEVTVSQADLSPLSGVCQLLNFKVRNPEGYDTEHVFFCESIKVDLKPKTIFDDKTVINQINIRGAEITFEGGLQKNNIQVILENIEKNLEKFSKEEDSGVNKKLQIDELLTTETKLNLSLPLMGSKTISTSLPDIQLRDLGTGSDGITAGEFIRRVTEQLRDRVLITTKEKAGDLGKVFSESFERLNLKSGVQKALKEWTR